MKIGNVSENRFTAAKGSLDVEVEIGGQWVTYAATPDDTAEMNSKILLEIQRRRAAGDLEVTPYTGQDVPTDAERLEAWRERAVCSGFQAKAALLRAGLLDAAEAAIAAADAETKLAWVEAREFRRTSPTIAAMAPALNLTDEQLDDLFREAAAIEA